MAEIWADRLTPQILWAALRSPLRPSAVRYLSINRPARILSRLLSRRIEVSQLTYDVGEARMPGSPMGLATEAQRIILEESLRRSSRRLTGLTEAGLPEPGARLFLLKTLATQVEQIVSLALYARISGARPVVMMDAQVYSMIEDWPCLDTLSIQPVGWVPVTVMGRRLWGFLALGLVAAKMLLLHLRGISFHAGHDPQVLIQWQRGIDLTRPNDYPWFPESQLPSDRITFYSDRPDTPLGADDRRALERLGHNWVDLLTGQLQWRSGLVLHQPILLLTRSLAVLSASPWCSFQLLKLLWLHSHWEAIFRRAQVRVFIQWSVYGSQMIAQAMAMRAARGATVLWHWSHMSHPSLMLTRQCDVFFTWGEYHRQILSAEASIVDRVLLNGHFSFQGADPSRATAIRSQLAERGATRIIGFFDSSLACCPEGLTPYSARTVGPVYKLLLELVDKQPNLGLVLKPKFALVPEGLQGLPGLAPLLRRALDTGRCVILSGSPLEAGLCCDLVAGIGFNSAALECAIAGIPAVYLDVAGDAESPMHTWSGRLVFRELTSFEAAVRGWLGGEDDLGRHGQELSSVDPFRDGRSWERLGSFLHALITRVAEYSNVERALHEAAERHEKNGALHLGNL